MALAAAQRVDAVAAVLAAGTAAVATGRGWPWAEGELPAWRVYAGDEIVDLATVEGMERHELSINCEGAVTGSASIDDAMHELAAEGLALLFAAPTFDLRLTRIGRRLQQEQQATLGLITLELVTEFYVQPIDPETIVS